MKLIILYVHHYLLLLPPQSKVQLELVEIQPQFKTNLLESVETYRTNLSSFMNNYKTVRKNTCTNCDYNVHVLSNTVDWSYGVWFTPKGS